MKLIDKDTLVAYIEKEKQYLSRRYEDESGAITAFNAILKFIETLDIKDYSFEKELCALDDTLFNLDGVAVVGATYYLTVEDIKEIAHHFFELGLNTQKRW